MCDLIYFPQPIAQPPPLPATLPATHVQVASLAVWPTACSGSTSDVTLPNFELGTASSDCGPLAASTQQHKEAV